MLQAADDEGDAGNDFHRSGRRWSWTRGRLETHVSEIMCSCVRLVSQDESRRQSSKCHLSEMELEPQAKGDA